MATKLKATKKAKPAPADLENQLARLEEIKRKEAQSQKEAEDFRQQRLELEKATKDARVSKLKADIKAITAKHEKAKAEELAPLEADLVALTGKAPTESQRVRLTEVERDALPEKLADVIKKAGVKGLKMGEIITNVGAPYTENHVRPFVLALLKKKVIKKAGKVSSTVYSINS